MNACIGQRRTHAWGLAVSATGQTGQSEAIHSAAGVLRALPKIKPAALASVPSASSAQLMPIRSKKVLNSARHMVADATDGTDDIFRTRAQTLIILVPRRPSREKGDFQDQRAEGTPSPAASPAILASIVGPARIDRLWQSTSAWARMRSLPCQMARFSSGRTITE